MLAKLVVALGGLLLCVSAAAAELHKGRLQGEQVARYVVPARAGQRLDVVLKSSSRSAYFNVQAEHASEAEFIGSIKGAHYRGAAATDGSYTITVYLMRHAARRNAVADYQLQVDVQ